MVPWVTGKCELTELVQLPGYSVDCPVRGQGYGYTANHGTSSERATEGLQAGTKEEDLLKRAQRSVWSSPTCLWLRLGLYLEL